jgi:hypothetical protein
MACPGVAWRGEYLLIGADTGRAGAAEGDGLYGGRRRAREDQEGRLVHVPQVLLLPVRPFHPGRIPGIHRLANT